MPLTTPIYKRSALVVASKPIFTVRVHGRCVIEFRRETYRGRANVDHLKNQETIFTEVSEAFFAQTLGICSTREYCKSPKFECEKLQKLPIKWIFRFSGGPH